MAVKKKGWNTLKNAVKQQRKFEIVIDRELTSEYVDYYKSLHPRSRKSFFYSNWKESGRTKNKIKNPKLLYATVSLNKLMPINREFYDSYRTQWHNFGKWVVEKYDMKDLQLTNCVVDIVLYKETRARRDYSNIYGGQKTWEDSLVESGVFVDDNSEHITQLLSDIRYDKEHPRMIYRISECGDLKTRAERLALHFKNFTD